ncbi:Spx/MgsR family RNA polymerase-binding regulatory protein [Bacillus sp. FJAT-22090]|uniref:Spx/MgsR family RNA polymerase-binding regulatory protein n=1 Tax=Bacillus sp. FJAT-22090 TaxID=1581038 RepID=UPI0011A2E668|nr:Spx/MgsR family RNA polymerase-binding regulatory protein [Bacillus sp. FJAT-22090]
MTVKLYTATSNTSSRKFKKHLIENKIPYVEQNMDHESLTWEQLSEILLYTENGVEDILSLRSNAYIELIQQGIDFEELTLTELHALVIENPRLIKAPIAVAKNNTLIGFHEESVAMLKSKAERRSSFMEILKQFDMQEVIC